MSDMSSATISWSAACGSSKSCSEIDPSFEGFLWRTRQVEARLLQRPVAGDGGDRAVERVAAGIVQQDARDGRLGRRDQAVGDQRVEDVAASAAARGRAPLIGPMA